MVPTVARVTAHPTLEFSVLQVSQSAVQVLRQARAAQEVPDTFGVRVAAQLDDSGQAALALAFAEQPAEGDQVTEQDGTPIYVAAEVAEPLAEQRLEVEDTDDGPQLALVPQDDQG